MKLKQHLVLYTYRDSAFTRQPYQKKVNIFSTLLQGLAFTLQERQVLGLQGLIAVGYKTQEEQVAHCTLAFDRYKDPLNQYLYMCQLNVSM